jgi:hypothetical protein
MAATRSKSRTANGHSAKGRKPARNAKRRDTRANMGTSRRPRATRGTANALMTVPSARASEQIHAAPAPFLLGWWLVWGPKDCMAAGCRPGCAAQI